MNTKILIIPILCSLLLAACGNSPKKAAQNETANTQVTDFESGEGAEEGTVEDEVTSEKMTEAEAIGYLETFKKLLLGDKIEELADLMHFPIEGDYAWEADKDDPYRTKRDFMENHSKFFGGDLKSLFQKADLKKAFKEDYAITIKREPNIELTIRFRIDDEQVLNFMADYNEIDLVETTTVYRARKIDGKIQLTAIFIAG